MRTHHAQRAQTIEVKWLERTALQRGADIASQRACFTQRELSCGWTRISSLAVLERRAIAHGPQFGMAWHGHGVRDHHCAPAIGLDSYCLEQRTRSRSSGPH